MRSSVRQGVPFRLPGADSVRAIGLGQAIDVGDRDPQSFHLANHGRRGRRRCRGDAEGTSERPFLGSGAIRQRGQYGRGAAEIGHPLATNQLPGMAGIKSAQTHLGAARRDHRPGIAPAVAMKQRQGPEVDRAGIQTGGNDLAERVQVGASVVIGHALWSSGGAAGVVNRNRAVLALLGVKRPGKRIRLSADQKRLVGLVAGAGLGGRIVASGCGAQPYRGQRMVKAVKRPRDQRRELIAGQQKRGARVVEDIRHLIR